MKISEETLEILKNYATINNGILIREGSVIATMSSDKNILSEAEISDIFPVNFGIYDINNFLSVLSLFKSDFELNFDDKNVIFSDNKSKILYRFAEEATIVVASEKRPSALSADIKFDLSNSDLEWIKKCASVLNSPNIAVKSDGNSVYLIAFDKNVENSNTMYLELKDVNPNGVAYNMIYKTQNFKMISGNYDVEISSKGISTFQHKDKKVKYWIVLDHTSKFGE